MKGPHVFAQADALESTREFLRSPWSLESNWQLLATVLGVSLFWVGLYWWDRRRRERLNDRNDPKSLFTQLCALHRVGREDRALLLRAAQHHGLDQAALVFVNPALLAAVDADDVADATKRDALMRRLFGEAAGAVESRA